MKISKVKEILCSISELQFKLPNGQFIPKHFHLTELGLTTKTFIDCGNTLREEKKINFQLWEENDYNHRLAPNKLINIITDTIKILNLDDLEVEIEYQDETIGKYNLDFVDGIFLLKNTQTACLAKDSCGSDEIGEKKNIKISEINYQNSCCSTKSECC